MTLVYLSLAWLTGIWLAQQAWQLGLIGCETPGWLFGGAIALVIVAAVGVGCNRALNADVRLRWAAALIAALLFGAWRYQAHPFAACVRPGDLAFYNGDEQQPAQATVEGVITGYPDVRDTRTFYRLQAERVTIEKETRTIRGLLLVQAPRYPELRYGDRIRASGRLITPPTFDDFDYRAYLSARGVHSLLQRGRVELVAHDQGSPFWVLLYGLRGRGSGPVGSHPAGAGRGAGEWYVAGHRERHRAGDRRSVQSHRHHARHRHFRQ